MIAEFAKSEDALAFAKLKGLLWYAVTAGVHYPYAVRERTDIADVRDPERFPGELSTAPRSDPEQRWRDQQCREDRQREDHEPDPYTERGLREKDFR